MRNKLLLRALVLLFIFIALPDTLVANRMDCTAVTGLHLPDVKISEALVVTPDPDPPGTAHPSHCKVTGVVGREIGFELLLPETWNGRFAMGGGGGFVGSIQNAAAWTANLGYATVGTDTGHRGDGGHAGWALNEAERQVNFGHLAIHRTAEVAKAIIRAYYGSAPEYNYFIGCSRGGGQALMEAQRYPEDFDGIIAGAPAFDWTGFSAEMVQNMQQCFPEPENLPAPLLTPEKLQFLEAEILEVCDSLDGVEDGVMEDPRTCTFDLSIIPACTTDPADPECLTPAQRTAIDEIYAPAVNPHGTISPGQPFGGEGDPWGWQNWITGPFQPNSDLPSLQWTFGTEFYKYLVFGDPDWDYTQYDFSTWKKDTEFAASFMNATDPDLTAFKSRGGKLILWHGWSDAALSALRSIEYYEEVEAFDPAVRDYFRMYLMPGVLHCGGGPGPDQVDWLNLIMDWVENGKAPDRIIATKLDAEGETLRKRPLCPYPLQAKYTGTGSTDAADNFVCSEP